MRGPLLILAFGLSCCLAVACGEDDAAPPSPGGAAGSGGLGGAGGGAGQIGGAGSGGESAAGNASGSGGANAAGSGGSGGGAAGAATMNLSIVKNGVSYPLDRAQFGLTTLAEGHEIYVEAHFGGDPACPAENSPSPDRTAIITGLLAEDPPGKTIDFAAHARANLLDFKGDITMEPILKGTAVTLTSLASNACPECAAGDPERFVAFEVNATLSDGTTITGTVRATHCGSLDE